MKHSQEDIILIIREYIKNPLAYLSLHNYKGGNDIPPCKLIQIKNILREIKDLSRISWIFNYLYSVGYVEWNRLIEAIEKDNTIQKPTKEEINKNNLYMESCRYYSVKESK